MKAPRRDSDYSDDQPAWDKLLSNIGQLRKARIKESPPISTDGLFHTSWNIIVTIYGFDGSLRYTLCGTLPYTGGCRPKVFGVVRCSAPTVAGVFLTSVQAIAITPPLILSISSPVTPTIPTVTPAALVIGPVSVIGPVLRLDSK
jgi:hypothetical protein